MLLGLAMPEAAAVPSGLLVLLKDLLASLSYPKASCTAALLIAIGSMHSQDTHERTI